MKLHVGGVQKAVEVQKGSDNTQYYFRRAGQFIYGKQNFFNGAIGVVPKNLDYYESTKDVPSFDVAPYVDSEWLLHFVARPEVYKPQEALSTGTGSKRFHVNAFYNLEIPLPSLTEQIKIKTYFDCVDSLITLHQRKYEKLKSMKAALLEKMFPSENETTPKIRFKGFTEAWEQRKLNEIVSYASSSLSAKDAADDGKWNLYDANQLIGKTNLFFVRDDYITIIKDGAGVGRVRLLPKNSAFIGTMGVLLPLNSDLLFDYALLTKADLSRKFSGSTIPHIYFKDYGNETYRSPSLLEQQKIGSLFEQLDSLITLHQRKCEKLKNLKKSLLERMFI